MPNNPYESPGQSSGLRPKRRYWKFACLGCLGLFGCLLVVDLLLRAVASGAKEDWWFVITSGFTALGELACLALAGITSIGWVLTRRRA